MKLLSMTVVLLINIAGLPLVIPVLVVRTAWLNARDLTGLLRLGMGLDRGDM